MKKSIIERKVKAAMEKNNNVNPFNMQYRKTMYKFVTARSEIDLLNETGNSYGWWVMFKRINGVLVLNNFNYSSSTCKHISKAAQCLWQLKIKFIRIEAPQGLQDLDRAKSHVAYLVAKALVADKYARKKNKWALKYAMEQVANLKKIKVVVSKKMINEQVKQVELNRRAKLDRVKAERFDKKMELALAQFNEVVTQIVNE